MHLHLEAVEISIAITWLRPLDCTLDRNNANAHSESINVMGY